MRTPPTPARLTALALALLTLQACTTTYVGRKLPPEGTLAAGDIGMPHMLTRHEYTLNITADASDPTKPLFALVRTSVPDRHQRYSIALDPALFTDGTITLNYGLLGNLGTSEVSTTSQVVASVKAIAGFATDFISSKGLKDESGVWTRFLSTLLVEPLSDCKSADSLLAYEKELVTAYKRTQSSTKISPEAENSRIAWISDRFHYRTEAEKICLQEVHTYLSRKVQAQGETEYKNALAAAKASNKSETATLTELEALYEDKNLAGITARLQKFDKATNPTVKAAYEKAKTYLTNVQNQTLAADLARFYVEMPLDVWRARHLLQVEADIEEARLALLLPPYDNSQGTMTDVEQKRFAELVEKQEKSLRKRDQLVNQVILQRRIAALDTLLKTNKSGDGTGLALLSVERDRLQSSLGQARADLLAKNQTFELAPKEKAKKVQPKEDVAVIQKKQEWVDAFNNLKITESPPPKFVLVLEPVPSPTPMKEKNATTTQTPKGPK